MTWQASGDVVPLILAGTQQGGTSGQAWRGGRGLLMIDNLSGTPSLEAQTPSGAWVAVRDQNTGGVVTGAATTGLCYNFELPACRIRMSTTAGAMNAWAIGI